MRARAWASRSPPTAPRARCSPTASPVGALKFKEWLDADKRASKRATTSTDIRGRHERRAPFILEGGSEWQSISINADDAQLLESRGWSVEDICRWFLTPPILIGHSEKQTSWGRASSRCARLPEVQPQPVAAADQAGDLEAAADAGGAGAGFFAEFNAEGLLAADSQGRANFYDKMTRMGAYTINEVRAKERLRPVPGGDVPRIQSRTPRSTTTSRRRRSSHEHSHIAGAARAGASGGARWDLHPQARAKWDSAVMAAATTKRVRSRSSSRSASTSSATV
jgi:hypothetical protein